MGPVLISPAYGAHGIGSLSTESNRQTPHQPTTSPGWIYPKHLAHQPAHSHHECKLSLYEQHGNRRSNSATCIHDGPESGIRIDGSKSTSVSLLSLPAGSRGEGDCPTYPWDSVSVNARMGVGCEILSLARLRRIRIFLIQIPRSQRSDRAPEEDPGKRHQEVIPPSAMLNHCREHGTHQT